MKKLLVVVLALLMTATMMVACGKNDAPATTDPVVESEDYGEEWDLFVETYIESAETASGGIIKCSVERNDDTVKLVGQYTIEVDKELTGDALMETFTDDFKSLTKQSVNLVAPEVTTVIVEYRANDGTVLCSIEC